MNLNEFENRMSQKTEAFERENRINVCSAETNVCSADLCLIRVISACLQQVASNCGFPGVPGSTCVLRGVSSAWFQQNDGFTANTGVLFRTYRRLGRT